MKNKIVSLAIIGLLLSCQQQNDVAVVDSAASGIELTPEEILSMLPAEEYELTEGQATKLLQKFVGNHEARTLNDIKVQVKSRSYLNKSREAGENILIYDMIVEKGGSRNIAIVSGDKRFPTVLAYFQEPDDVHKNINCNSLLIEASKSVLQDNIEIISRLKDSLQQKTIQKISKVLNVSKDEISYTLIQSKLSIGQQQSRSTIIKEPNADLSRFGPFISVSWDTGMPYNRLMSQNCSDNWLWDFRYPISSIVVATAQILSMFEPSLTANQTKINWAYLKEKEEIHEDSDYFGSYVQDPIDKRNMIANLMLYIGNQCNVNYTCSGSSVDANKVVGFLKRYNINMSGKKSMNTSVMKQTLDNIDPVLMYGQTNDTGGHWWVVDGYCSRIATRGDSFFPGFDIYMHANMGMGKSYNGYYLVGSDGTLTFDASFAHFNKNLSMYTVEN